MIISLIDEFGICFDMSLCVFNDPIKSSRQGSLYLHVCQIPARIGPVINDRGTCHNEDKAGLVCRGVGGEKVITTMALMDPFFKGLILDNKTNEAAIDFFLENLVSIQN